MVIPNPPGGNSDLLGRGFANHLNGRWNQPVVPDNRTGAGGIIAAELVARAAPDGYTIFTGNIGPNAINKALYERLPYDPATDFTPISQFIGVPNVLVVHPSVPAHSVAELIALARARPGGLAYASSGSGQSPHISAAWFANAAGIDMVHVPYRGTGPSLQDLLAGNVQMIFENISNAMPHIRAGTLRPLAVTSARRAPSLPDLPTIAEAAGLQGYEVTSWFGLFGPARLPPSLVDRYHAEVVGYLRTPATRTLLDGLGAEIVGNSPQGFAAFVQAEIAKWGAGDPAGRGEALEPIAGGRERLEA
jgi:tripartite-type tricarboxylate transporter receptor subunit TctC